MRIKQCYSAFGHFGALFRNKYNLAQYKDRTKPAVFYGVYGNQIDILLKHESYALVLWAGSDILDFIHPSRREKLNLVRNNSLIQHGAFSNFIAKDLDSVGIPYKMIRFVPSANNDITPVPLGNNISVYKAHSAKYGNKLYYEIKEKLNNYNFIEYDFHTYPRTEEGRRELLDMYKNSFIGLRFTKHDGLSSTAIELGLMGRRIVWNGDTPNALNYANKDDIVNLINLEFKNKDNFDFVKLNKEMIHFLDIGEEWLNYE